MGDLRDFNIGEFSKIVTSTGSMPLGVDDMLGPSARQPLIDYAALAGRLHRQAGFVAGPLAPFARAEAEWFSGNVYRLASDLSDIDIAKAMHGPAHPDCYAMVGGYTERAAEFIRGLEARRQIVASEGGFEAVWQSRFAEAAAEARWGRFSSVMNGVGVGLLIVTGCVVAGLASLGVLKAVEIYHEHQSRKR
ncbi:MAG: hypothetical protein HYY44_05885 [Deltaproteobacteria bacterium]|nr:hypothetical protein [Deltaproteobacteria bacterium]